VISHCARIELGNPVYLFRMIKIYLYKLRANCIAADWPRAKRERFTFTAGVTCRFCFRDGTRCLPHRFTGISFFDSRAVNGKLLLCRETGCDSRTRATALFLSELFYGSGSTLESLPFFVG